MQEKTKIEFAKVVPGVLAGIAAIIGAVVGLVKVIDTMLRRTALTRRHQIRRDLQ